MYVSKLIVKGYRSLADISINFNPGINVIVGKNNAGKSNIIRALNLILGERHPSYIRFENRDFHSDGSDSVSSITIATRLDGSLDSQDLPDKGTYVFKIDDFSPTWDEDSIQKIKYARRDRFKQLSELFNDIQNSSERWIILHAEKEGEENIYGMIYKVDEEWYRVNLTNPLRDLLITTAYVPSYRDPEKMLKVTEYSWYGKLIKKIYSEGLGSHEEEIKEIQENYSAKIGDIFSDATKELRKRLRRAIFHHEISFKPGAYTKDDDYKSITLFVNDGIDSPHYDKGSGIQSALVIALFTYYCECFHKGSSLLLLEEPENHLHPQGRRALEGELLRFVKNGDNGKRQVIISTHSSEFLRSVELKSLARVHKKPGSTWTEIYQIEEEKIDDETKRKFKQVMMQKGVELFFADGAILVEGGEEYLLPQLFDIFSGEKRWLDSYNISVIRVDGKKSFRNYINVMNQLGIWWIILTDLDFLYDGLRSLKRVVEKNEIEFTRRIASEIDTYLNEELKNVDDDRKKSMRKTKRMEKLKSMVERDDIKELINRLKQRGIFILHKGELEDYFTDKTIQLDTSSKERRVLELALILSEIRDDSLSEWFKDEIIFKELFEAVKGRLGND